MRPSEFVQVKANMISNNIAPRGGRDPLVVTESGLDCIPAGYKVYPRRIHRSASTCGYGHLL